MSSVQDNRYSKEDEERAAAFERRLADVAVSVAARFARGNTAMQQGSVLTPDAQEAEREALRMARRGSLQSA